MRLSGKKGLPSAINGNGMRGEGLHGFTNKSHMCVLTQLLLANQFESDNYSRHSK